MNTKFKLRQRVWVIWSDEVIEVSINRILTTMWYEGCEESYRECSMSEYELNNQRGQYKMFRECFIFPSKEELIKSL